MLRNSKMAASPLVLIALPYVNSLLIAYLINFKPKLKPAPPVSSSNTVERVKTSKILSLNMKLQVPPLSKTIKIFQNPFVNSAMLKT